MRLFAPKEDRPTPKEVYNWRIYACATVASFASCMIGYDSAFIGTTLALPSFTEEFEFSSYSPESLSSLKADIVSVYQAGAFFGSLFAYGTSYYLGRRRSLLVFSLVFIVGAAMMLGASRERGLGLILAGRVLAGIGVGGASNMTPIYIAELAPPAVRGRLVGIYEVGWQIGGLVGFWIDYGVNRTQPPDRTQWIIPFAVQLIPAGLLFLGSMWIPESPRWLFLKGRREEAMRVLCWVRSLGPTDLYILEEVSFIDRDLELDHGATGEGFWKPFLRLGDRTIQHRFLLGALLFVFQNGSGINAINYYSPTVFSSIGIRGTDTSFLTTGIFGVVKTIMTFAWQLYLIDHVGRRRLLIIGGFGGSICMWIIGAYIKLSGAGTKTTAPDAPLTSGGIAAIVFFYLWTAVYSTTWNGTPWVINSEIFDQSTRSLGQANAAANNWFWNFIVSRFTPRMFDSWKGYGVYFFFASLMILSIVFVWFCIPETKSVPLEFTDLLFEIKPTWKAHGKLMQELATEDQEFRRNNNNDTLKNSDESGEVFMLERVNMA